MSATRIPKNTKIIGLIVLAAAVVAFLYFGGYIGKKTTASVEIEKGKIEMSPIKQTNPNVKQDNLPSKNVANEGFEIRMAHYAWNTHMGLNFANGGPITTRGSLMNKAGIRLTQRRIDDNEPLFAELEKFANELQSNPQPTSGVHFISFMGDAGAIFMDGLKKHLDKFGPEYHPVIIASFGKSDGEDKLQGPPEWINNPKDATGVVIATVIRDGDWNIIVQWASEHDLKVNPDPTTYDPDAINILDCKSYIESGEKYISGYKETRPVVKNGRLTGEKKEITVSGVSSWTPVDVNVAEGRGGLVTIASTKTYGGQMPNVVVGIKKWCEANKNHVVDFIDAAFKGADQVSNFQAALDRGGEISDQIYGDNKGGAYWVNYFRGIQKRDKQGVRVDLGGSRVHNLADNLVWFGMTGGLNMYKATYERFGNIVKKMYPSILPSYPDVDEIIDTQYLKALKAKTGNVDISAAQPTYDNSAIVEQTGRSTRYIDFQTGKYTFAKSATEELKDLAASLSINDKVKVEIHGYTDNVGNAEKNQILSLKRAQAVADALYRIDPKLFSHTRIKPVGHGQNNARGDNSTEAGRAQNRRVEIVIGN